MACMGLYRKTMKANCGKIGYWKREKRERGERERREKVSWEVRVAGCATVRLLGSVFCDVCKERRKPHLL